MKKILLCLLLLLVLLVPVGNINVSAKGYSGVLVAADQPVTQPKEQYVGDDPCNDNNILKAFRFFGYLVLACKYLIPLIIATVGVLDMFKAVTANNQDAILKQGKVLIIRVFVGLVIMLLPGIVYTLIDTMVPGADTGSVKCAKCFLSPTNDSNCAGKYH